MKEEKWQLIGLPLYVTVNEAARIAGISQHQMRAYVNDQVRPLPHLKAGSKVLVRVAALPEYLKSREAV